MKIFHQDYLEGIETWDDLFREWSNFVYVGDEVRRVLPEPTNPEQRERFIQERQRLVQEEQMMQVNYIVTQEVRDSPINIDFSKNTIHRMLDLAALFVTARTHEELESWLQIPQERVRSLVEKNKPMTDGQVAWALHGHRDSFITFYAGSAAYEFSSKASSRIRQAAFLPKKEIRKKVMQTLADKLDFDVEVFSKKFKDRFVPLIAALEKEGDLKEYRTQLAHSLDGTFEEYVDSLEANKKSIAKMQELGLDVELWRRGIEAKSVPIAAIGAIDPNKVRADLTREASGSLTAILREEIGTSAQPHLLARKISKKCLGKPVKYREANFDGNKFVEEITPHMLESDDNLLSVVNVAKDYLAKHRDVGDISTHLFHLTKVADRLKGKVKLKDKIGLDETVSLAMHLADKDPFTITDIGNDSGACIGVYEEDGQGMSNGVYMPYYIKDVATQFLQLNLGKERSGLALLFAGYDAKEQPTLIVNSEEFGKRFEKNDHLIDPAIRESLEYLREFALAVGFKRMVVGSHDYNTAVDYLKNKEFEIVHEEFEKFDSFNEYFYSDIHDRRRTDGSVITNCEFYEIPLEDPLEQKAQYVVTRMAGDERVFIKDQETGEYKLHIHATLTQCSKWGDRLEEMYIQILEEEATRGVNKLALKEQELTDDILIYNPKSKKFRAKKIPLDLYLSAFE